MIPVAIARPHRAGEHTTQIISPAGIELEKRGIGASARFIHNVAMEDRDVADNLLATEAFTPQGNRSSHPPHRHDQDDFPIVTYL